jgi:hypothetical protein
MPLSDVHTCHCSYCQQETLHPDQELHRQMNLRLRHLDEQQRRWYVAVESKRIGPGGDRLLSQITGLDEKTRKPWTARTGQFAGRATNRAGTSPWRRSSASRKKDAELESTLQSLVGPETAGDPNSREAVGAESLAAVEPASERPGP